MDVRYINALRNATNAWAKDQVTDSLTLQELQRRSRDVPATPATTPTAAQMGVLQPELARYGNLGTKLNIFA